jgi:ATP-dependent Lon protease
MKNKNKRNRKKSIPKKNKSSDSSSSSGSDSEYKPLTENEVVTDFIVDETDIEDNNPQIIIFDNINFDKLSKRPTKKRKINNTVENLAFDNYTEEEQEYFNSQNKEQKRKLSDLESEIYKINHIDTPLRFKILQTNMKPEIKAFAIKKIEYLNGMSSGSSEYYKLVNWVESLCKIPFGVTKGISIIQNNKKPNLIEIKNFLDTTKKTMDNVVYGHENTKDQIIRFLAQWIVNPETKGSVIGIHGKPGTAKTTIIKDGVCKALDIPFAIVPLGGASDGSYLEGHSYTYEGSAWGKIADIIMKTGCMNPLLYFDELDKVSETPKGQDLVNLLIHLTDPSQSENFHDKYFMDIPLDLSKSIIIFTYNDDSLINPILKDRMIRISVDDYKINDKINITKKHLLPSLDKQFSLQKDNILISEENIKYIIENIQDEAGVRSLRRSLELIYSNVNLRRLLAEKLDNKDPLYIIPYNFPINIDTKVINLLLNKYKLKKQENESISHMYL